MIPQGCAASSNVASQGSVIQNHTIASSTTNSIPAPSTFPEFINSTFLSLIDTSRRPALPTSVLSIASGAAADQLSLSLKSLGVNTSAIRGAASIFLDAAGAFTFPPSPPKSSVPGSLTASSKFSTASKSSSPVQEKAPGTVHRKALPHLTLHPF